MYVFLRTSTICIVAAFQPIISLPILNYNLTFSSRLVLDKFAEVTVGIENYNRRKVLAGIVMIENCDINSAKVISVSTGTKCVNGEHLSCYGAVLNDSHAEIVSRRCLMDFFYTQLELHTNAGKLLA